MSGTANQKQLDATLWEIFNAWPPAKEKPFHKIRWEVFEGLAPYYERIIESKYVLLRSLLKSWDTHLSAFGGDSTHSDWSIFRPLSPAREEGWSDWLAHVLATSTTGYFAQCLLQIPQFRLSDYAEPQKVEREVSHLGYRADIIVEWQNKRFSHIEVKIGDEHLYKTFKTSVNLRKKYRAPNENWTNFILLLSRQLISWEQIKESSDPIAEIKSLTWDDVCVAIRRALLTKEAITWKVWAYSLLGAIEQRLIEYPGHLLDKRPIENVDEKINILSRGLKDG